MNSVYLDISYCKISRLYYVTLNFYIMATKYSFQITTAVFVGTKIFTSCKKFHTINYHAWDIARPYYFYE